MRFKTLQIFSIGRNGLYTDQLVFGEHITQVIGPNGCGKTPIIQSIAFCLGYPCKFRNDIYERCAHAILKIESQGRSLEIKRIYSKEIDIHVTELEGSSQRFFNEENFSKFMFEWLGFSIKRIVTIGKKSTEPYIATLLPLFYTDQDRGYSDIYVHESRFIQDQFSEMMRFVFKLPAKNFFDKKKKRISVKNELDQLDKLVKDKFHLLELSKGAVSAFPMKSYEISEEINRINEELLKIESYGIMKDESLSLIDDLISKHRDQLRKVERELKDIHKRREGCSVIISEIEFEIKTLGLNEEARRVFRSFKEICSNENCGLFSLSSDSYAKNLLYLKDQIKDLERNNRSDEQREIVLKQEVESIKNIIKNIIDERNQKILVEKSPIAATISNLTKEIYRLQLQQYEIEKLEKTQEEYFSIIKRRDAALAEYNSLDKTSYSDPDIVRVKADLRQTYLYWMEELHTSNVSRDISFKDDFVPIFGNETIAQLKGSTKVRAILSFHAALLELCAKNKIEFNFLVLDTPKQHEINNDDLNRYFKSLKSLCAQNNIQLIFSTTEYKYYGDHLDKTWEPRYQGNEQLMFMKESA